LIFKQPKKRCLSKGILISDFVDCCSLDTVLDQLHNIRANSKTEQNYRERAKQQLIGQVVLTRYNNRTYRINDIEWNASPLSTFSYQKGKSTYLQYYAMQHHLQIQDRTQPLLFHKPRRKNADRIYLIPELCSMTGLYANNFIYLF
jgi:aubergine